LIPNVFICAKLLCCFFEVRLTGDFQKIEKHLPQLDQRYREQKCERILQVQTLFRKTKPIGHLQTGKEGTDELKKEIQEYVKTHTAPYKYPRIVEFVTELPKTISGKVRRVEIRKNDLEKLQK
jgi:acyl-CoA synthetase (AMP-forming)/AMP-acid ligase II